MWYLIEGTTNFLPELHLTNNASVLVGTLGYFSGRFQSTQQLFIREIFQYYIGICSKLRPLEFFENSKSAAFYILARARAYVPMSVCLSVRDTIE